MKRREFIKVLGGAAAAWPLAARAQQPDRMRRVSRDQVVCRGRRMDEARSRGVRHGLQRARVLSSAATSGSTLAGRGQTDGAALSQRLDQNRVEVHARPHSVRHGCGAFDPGATTAIPIIFMGGDPVGSGFVASFPRPGGNVNRCHHNGVLTDLLGRNGGSCYREIVPRINRVALLVDPNNPNAKAVTNRHAGGGSASGLQGYVSEREVY